MQKAISACAGAIVTSLTITPFDVVKTRQQLWEAPALVASEAGSSAESCCVKVATLLPPPVRSMALCSQCTHYETFHGGLSESLRPKGRDFWHPPRPSTAAYQLNTFEMLIAIVRHEGLGALWSGLGPALTMSLPATVLYMTAYDELRARFSRSDSRALSAWAPMAAGISARTFAAAIVSPIELIRTQMQSGQWEAGVGLFGGLRRTRALHGVRGLYRGLMPTLLRDIPFSGIYWTLYEMNRRVAHQHELSPFAASFSAGAGAGMVAACVTTPCDVVKTRMQIALYSESGSSTARSAWGTLRHIVELDGASALTAGMATRMVKVAPACAIMVSSYDMGKRFFAGMPE
jgi:solute carrier family 25 protein 39/40